MKFLLFILAGLICVGYFVTQKQVRANVQDAIENNAAVIGMTASEATRSLGKPLSTKSTQSLLGKAEVLTFSDGSEITFNAGRATKIETVKLSKELMNLRKVQEAQKSGASAASAGPAGPGLPTGWKSQTWGTALDRRPYVKYNGHVFYSNSDDPDKLGSATESERRNGLYRGR